MIKKITGFLAAVCILASSSALADNADWVGTTFECGDHWLNAQVKIVDVYTGRGIVEGDIGVYKTSDTTVLAADFGDKVYFTFEMLGDEVGTVLQVVLEGESFATGKLTLNGEEVPYTMSCFLYND